MAAQARPGGDPEEYTREIRRLLVQVIDHLEADVTQVNEPRAMALFETSREVLKGLLTAYEHYEQGTERAWRR